MEYHYPYFGKLGLSKNYSIFIKLLPLILHNVITGQWTKILGFMESVTQNLSEMGLYQIQSLFSIVARMLETSRGHDNGKSFVFLTDTLENERYRWQRNLVSILI